MKKNYIYNLTLSIVNILFPILSFPYASRILGASGIGKVQMVSAFALYFALIAALGIPVYGIQAIAKVRHDKKALSAVFSELISIYFFTSLIVALVYIMIISVFPFFRSNQIMYYYAGLIVLLGFTSIDWFYSGIEEFKVISLRSVFIKIISLVFLYVFVKDAHDYRIYLFIFIFSLLGNNIISVLLVRKRTAFVFRNLHLKRHMRPLVFIFGTNVATSMYMVLDTVILGFLSTETAVGLYTAAVKLTKISIPFITSFAAVLIPGLSKKFSENHYTQAQELLDKSFQYISFFSIPVAAGLFVLAPEFILVFSGGQFINAIPSMQILSLLPIIIGFGYFFSLQILVPAGKNKEMFYSVFTGMLAGLLLNFLLVPAFSQIGASIANVVCELLVTGLYFYFIQKEYSFHYNWELLLKAALSSIIFIPVVLFMRHLHFPAILTLLCSVILCSLCYFLIQYVVFKNIFISKLVEWMLILMKIRKPD